MNKELNIALDSLSEQTSRMKIALHYVFGDMDKARDMISGSYHDLYVLKGTFLSSSINGAFVMFYNFHYNKLHDSHVVIIPTFMTKQLDSALDWKVFEKELLELQSQPEYNPTLSNSLKTKFNENFTPGFLKELTRFIEGRNTISIERNFQKLIQFSLNLQRIDIKIDSQKLSSLDMELHSATAHKTDPESLSAPDQIDTTKENQKQSGSDEEVREGRDGVKLILSGSLILSPIKGKDISQLQSGDRIKVTITDKNPKAITVAKALNAYVDESFKPVTARIKNMSHEVGKGYTIYAIIAKGVFVKIIEEEASIKVQMDSTYEMARGTNEEDKRNILPVVIAFSVLVIVIVIVVAFFLI